jgi:hypothetical protein
MHKILKRLKWSRGSCDPISAVITDGDTFEIPSDHLAEGEDEIRFFRVLVMLLVDRQAVREREHGVCPMYRHPPRSATR